MSLEARIFLLEGLAFEGSTSTGNVVMINASKGAAGNVGFRPMELFLVSLGACSGVSMIQILQKKRIDISGFWINVKGEKAKTPPTIFTDIDMEYVVKGKNIPEKAVKSAFELTKKTCSVIAMVKPTTNVTTRYRIIEE
ncbi:MAG: OsmC family protein [Nitrospirota bacterium]